MTLADNPSSDSVLVFLHQAIMRLMLLNHIRTDSVRQVEEEQEPLYTEEEMRRCLDKIDVIDYHQVNKNDNHIIILL